MQPLSDAAQGRAYIYGLYQNQYNEVLKPAIKYFRQAQDSFSQGMNLARNRAPLTYDVIKHRFVDGIGAGGMLPFDTTAKWKRDHLIHQIDQFAIYLFNDDERKQECVKAYLHQKLGGITPFEYIHRGDLAKEDKVWKLLNKVENKKFLSCEEKAEKKEYLASDAYKIDQIDKQIEVLNRDLQQKEQDIPDIFLNLDPVIVKVEARLERPISDNGGRALRAILEALNKIKQRHTNGQRLRDLSFQEMLKEGKNYRNCLDDYRDIDQIYRYLEGCDVLRQQKLKLEEERRALLGEDEVVPVVVEGNDALVDGEPVEDAEILADPVIREENNALDEDKPPQKTSWISRLFSPVANFFISLWRWLKNLFS